MAALAGQVLAVSQKARRGPRALERQPGVDEGGGAAVMVHEERLHMYTHKQETQRMSLYFFTHLHTSVCM